MEVKVINKPKPEKPEELLLILLCPGEVGVHANGNYWVGAVGGLVRDKGGQVQAWSRTDSQLKETTVRPLPDATATLVIDLGGKSEKEVPTNATSEHGSGIHVAGYHAQAVTKPFVLVQQLNRNLKERLENICKKGKFLILLEGKVMSDYKGLFDGVDLAGYLVKVFCVMSFIVVSLCIAVGILGSIGWCIYKLLGF